MNKTVKKYAPQGSNVKLRFQKHALPPLLGIGVMVLGLGFFNSQVIAGKIASSNYAPNTQNTYQTAQIDDVTLQADSSEPKLIIEKLNITAPVIYDQVEVDERSFQIALRDGVVHYPNTGIPGTKGNIVIFGHSSNQVWAKGDYKFVFATLDKLEIGDKIILDYESKRFVYTVKSEKIVLPTDLSVLEPSNNSILTLITCTPVGSNAKRLIVTAEQTLPSTVQPISETTTSSTKRDEKLYGEEQLPSQSSPSIWEEIKALF